MFNEFNTAQRPIIEYLIGLGWEFVSPETVESLRSSTKEPLLTPILRPKLLELNPAMTENEANDVIRRLKLIRETIEGNEEFLKFLRAEKTFFSSRENRELNLKLIDFENPENNSFNFTVEFWFEDVGRIRTDFALFINGIPVAVIETKAPFAGSEFDDWLGEAFSQIKRYHEQAPSLMKYVQFYALSEGLHLYYSATWNFNERNLYKWKTETSEIGLEDLVRSLFKKERILGIIEDYIVFFNQDDELNKYILRPHQIRAVERIIKRVKTRDAKTGLIWHTQGSGKTLTMMVAAKKLRRIPELESPTIMIVVDRIDLQDQLSRNLEAFGLPFEVAESKQHLKSLLKSDYRGVIVTLIHKFQGMEENVNTRDNIIVFIDEAHRSQEGDLGVYMRSALPNAMLFGFTGTPIDKGKVGKGTFNLFAREDEERYRRRYLDKYSIKDSISDGTTVPLYYNLAPLEYRINREEILEEFFRLYEESGVTSVEELNKLLDRIPKIKEALKAEDRIRKVAKFIAEHYRNFVEPSGFKAFVVAVDREACAMYMEAFRELYERGESPLPPDYFRVVYTSSNKDTELLRKYWLSDEEEKVVRKNFKDKYKLPKIFILTEKLLTGYDAPILQTMYLDKPMKDHTLLQAIARVNRPYIDDEIEKEAGVIVDFIGIFEDLQRALTFDAESIEGAVIDLELLKKRFSELMDDAREYIELLEGDESMDKKLEKLVDYFAEEEKRKEFMKLFKKIQQIFEIISPDPFLRPYLEDYKTLLKIHRTIKAEFYPAEKERRELLKKTKEIIRKNVEIEHIVDDLPVYRIDEHIADLLKNDGLNERIKIYNLRRSLILYIRERKKEIPYLEMLVDKIEEVIRRLERKQISSKEALEELLRHSEFAVESEREYRDSKLDSKVFSVYWLLRTYGIENAELAERIVNVLMSNTAWTYSDSVKQEKAVEIYGLLRETGVKTKDMVRITKDLMRLGIKFVEG